MNSIEDQAVARLIESQDSPWLDDSLLAVFLLRSAGLQAFAVAELLKDPGKAVACGSYLLEVAHEHDSLQRLRYWGARIMEGVREQIAESLLIPPLIRAYSQQDYRDTRWSISMALAKIVNEEGELLVSNIEAHLDEDSKAELYCNLRSYSSVDYRPS